MPPLGSPAVTKHGAQRAFRTAQGTYGKHTHTRVRTPASPPATHRPPLLTVREGVTMAVQGPVLAHRHPWSPPPRRPSRARVKAATVSSVCQGPSQPPESLRECEGGGAHSERARVQASTDTRSGWWRLLHPPTRAGSPQPSHSECAHVVAQPDSPSGCQWHCTYMCPCEAKELPPR